MVNSNHLKINSKKKNILKITSEMLSIRKVEPKNPPVLNYYSFGGFPLLLSSLVYKEL